MPKKATPARNGVQRAKPKTQKSFELVRPVSQVQEQEIEETSVTEEEPTLVEPASETSADAKLSSELAALPTVPQKKARSSSIATEVAPVETVTPKTTAAVETPVATAKGSASVRLSARKNT